MVGPLSLYLRANVPPLRKSVSVQSSLLGKVGFHWFYNVFQLTVFSLRGSTMVRGATHAAPAGNVDFPLVLHCSPCEIARAQLLGTAAGPFPRRGRMGDLLVFPMVFGCFMETVFGRFFFARGSRPETVVFIRF